MKILIVEDEIMVARALMRMLGNLNINTHQVDHKMDLNGAMKEIRTNPPDLLMLDEPIAHRTPGYPWFLALVRSASTRPLLTLVSIQGGLAIASMMISASAQRDMVSIIGDTWPTANFPAMALPLQKMAVSISSKCGFRRRGMEAFRGREGQA